MDGRTGHEVTTSALKPCLSPPPPCRPLPPCRRSYSAMPRAVCPAVRCVVPPFLTVPRRPCHLFAVPPALRYRRAAVPPLLQCRAASHTHTPSNLTSQ